MSERAVVYPELVLLDEIGRADGVRAEDHFGIGDVERIGSAFLGDDAGPGGTLFHCSTSPTLMLLLLPALESTWSRLIASIGLL